MTPKIDDEWKEIFKSLNHYSHWFSNANKLKQAGDLLFEAHLASQKISQEESGETGYSDINDVATLLYGLAMENVLKAVLLKEGVARVESSGEINWEADSVASTKPKQLPTNDHDLLGMSRLIKSLNLNADHENLLTRLSAFVCWAGKYPTPKSLKAKEKEFKGLLLSNQPNAAETMLPVAFEPEDKKLFDIIYEILEQRNDRIEIVRHE